MWFVCTGMLYKQHWTIMDGKAKAINNNCNDCGECFAVCPCGAIVTEGDMAEVVTYNQKTFTVNSDHLLNMLKFRRSVRDYNKQAIEPDKLKQIFEAGRYTPTGGNCQDVRYILVQEQLEELKQLTAESLVQFGEKIEATNKEKGLPVPEQTVIFRIMQQKLEAGNDLFFYNAPALIVLIGRNDYLMPPEVHTSLACSNMVLMANSLGLGVCYNGLFALAAGNSEKIQSFLGLQEQEKVTLAFVVGYSNVRFAELPQETK